MNIFTVLALNMLLQISNGSYQKQYIYQGDAIKYEESLEFISCRNCKTPSVKTKRAPAQKKNENYKTEKISKKLTPPAETPKIREPRGPQPNGATAPKSHTKLYQENELLQVSNKALRKNENQKIKNISRSGNFPVNLEKNRTVNEMKIVIVYFDFDKADIKEEEKEKILGIKGDPIRITGYTDATGLKERNDVLSEQRAKVVADFIKITKGIMLSPKVVQGKGLCCYAEANETAEGRVKNRRAEIIFRTVTYKGANNQ